MDKLLEQFSLGLFFWQLILFVGLVLLLKKFAWGPILKSVGEREEGIKSALDEADNARKEIQNLNADNARILKEARIERDVLLKEAREMKENVLFLKLKTKHNYKPIKLLSKHKLQFRLKNKQRLLI